MSHKQNLHTHTTYADGRDTPEEMVAAALAAGFSSLGFSEHAYLPYSKHPNQMTSERQKAYLAEVAALKRGYADRISVFCGLEYDFYSEADTAGLDYLIGSVHYLDTPCGVRTFDRGLAEMRAYIDECFGGEPLALARAYFGTVACLPERGRFDIIGHFDLIAKHNRQAGFFDLTDKEYLRLGYEAIGALRGKIPYFEVNTGAIARGYADAPYPAMPFLLELHRLGFGAVITSDCHDKRYLDCGFPEARELLLAAGFRSYFILTDNGFSEVGL